MRRLNYKSKRRIAKATDQSKKSKKAKGQPMEEGIRRQRRPTNADRAKIKVMRERRVPKGLPDKPIAQEIARKLGLSASTVYHNIRKMVERNELKKNPNQKEREVYTKKEEKTIRTERKTLIPKGFDDWEIARKTAKKIRRPVGGLKDKIERMVEKGDLPKNPNKTVRKSRPERNINILKIVNPKEVRWVMQRRKQLASIGLADASIVRILAKESETMGKKKIKKIIATLVKNGKLKENKNNEETSKLIEKMILARMGLIPKGMDDRKIAKRIARRLKKKPQTVEFIIWRAVKDGKCQENPNNHKTE